MILHDLLILLSVSARDYQIVLTRYEPVIFLKPVWLSNFVKSFDLSFNLFYLFSCILFCKLDGLICFLSRFLLFNWAFLLDLVIFLNIHLSWQFQVKLYNKHFALTRKYSFWVELFIFCRVEHHKNFLFFILHFLNIICKHISWPLFLFDHSINFIPREPTLNHCL